MKKFGPSDVIDIEVDGIAEFDYPDFVDAFICYAVCKDTKRELTGPELEQLNDDHPEIAQEYALENY